MSLVKVFIVGLPQAGGNADSPEASAASIIMHNYGVARLNT